MSTRKAEKSPKKRTPQFIIWYTYEEMGVPQKGWRSLNIGLSGSYKTGGGAARAITRYLQKFPEQRPDVQYSVRKVGK